MVGIGFSHREVSLSRLPGWEDNSWGYHGDDGRAFCCLGTGESFGPTFTTGDIVGCGVDYTGAGPEKEGKERSRESAAGKKTEGEGGRVFFTKNGDMLGELCLFVGCLLWCAPAFGQITLLITRCSEVLLTESPP